MEVIRYGKKMRCGYTTGSCAAAAAKAAVIRLLGGECREVRVRTPSGEVLLIKISECRVEGDEAICRVVKDAGDDADATDGIAIYAKVSLRGDGRVLIEGGEGIGRFKENSPYGKKGEAAINKVPRRMIEASVLEAHPGGANVLIFAPEGREIAKKTYNPRMGIEGGISILGTTGIVYPMSEEAYKKVMYTELEVMRKNTDEAVLTFGNYGMEYIRKAELSKETVKISNFVGEALLYCRELGFKKVTLVGHVGKMCKISIGAFNTSSRVVDSRVEAFVYYLAKNGAPRDLIESVERFKTAEECANFLRESGYDRVLEDMKEGIVRRIKAYLKEDNMKIEVFMYTFKEMQGWGKWSSWE
ncbi:cobalt-precorrin-5B (C(1))-methyltransferase CbiD [Thermovenabulum gondwanense]|uniref:Cobalt-precorrin-5B C(1)-methyltransferase n=1 Tax=Thermovenabulum gondwanense TaxID=520767 RepID=A0A161QCM9_9FIRM|nr:cobalt-precorrin-5B (C(1))-methyltransferase CbiD [Thermovenabulum gondwanense]KYO67028.1 Cobalt-precorrin-5B C(1)-methyltransferase [Thermovenabulum gondwanense]